MKITAEPLEDFVVLRLKGELDTLSCPSFLREIDRLLTEGATRIALNLRMVRFINSTAIGAIVRATKALRSHGGELVVSQPSSFVRGVMEKTGLDSLVPIRGTDEEALRALSDGGELVAAGAPEAGALSDETSLLFSLSDSDRVEHFLPKQIRASAADPRHGHRFGLNWRGVGRISAMDEDGLRFSWDGGTTELAPFEMGQMLSLGTQLELKFRLPLLQRGFCESSATVTEVVERSDGVELQATFLDMEPDVSRAVRQYVADIRYLRDELQGHRRELGQASGVGG